MTNRRAEAAALGITIPHYDVLFLPCPFCGASVDTPCPQRAAHPSRQKSARDRALAASHQIQADYENEQRRKYPDGTPGGWLPGEWYRVVTTEGTTWRMLGASAAKSRSGQPFADAAIEERASGYKWSVHLAGDTLADAGFTKILSRAKDRAKAEVDAQEAWFTEDRT